jgi:hypothetical protein
MYIPVPMKNSPHEPGTFTAGCSSLVLLPTLILSVPLFLFGAFHVAICIWGAAGSIILTLWLMNAMFGEHDRNPAPSRQRVAYHREVHAKETVYFRPNREPEPNSAEIEIPLSEYPPCKDPLTGRVYTAGELRERMLRERDAR